MAKFRIGGGEIYERVISYVFEIEAKNITEAKKILDYEENADLSLITSNIVEGPIFHNEEYSFALDDLDTIEEVKSKE